MHGLKSAIDRGADAWARSLPGRVLDRYVSRSGPLLANGLAYGLLFAFFAGVWIAVSVFGLIMVGNIDWQQMLIDAVREVIPGVADSFLTSSALGAMSSALTWTGLATLAIFWWTVTGWMNSLRHAVRTMFDDCGDELISSSQGYAIRLPPSPSQYCSFFRPRPVRCPAASYADCCNGAASPAVRCPAPCFWR